MRNLFKSRTINDKIMTLAMATISLTAICDVKMTSQGRYMFFCPNVNNAFPSHIPVNYLNGRLSHMTRINENSLVWYSDESGLLSGIWIPIF